MTGAVLLFSIAAALGCFSIAVCTCLVVLKRGRDLFHLALVASFGVATFWLGIATMLSIVHERGGDVVMALGLSRLAAGVCLIIAAWRLAKVTPYLLTMPTRGQLTERERVLQVENDLVRELHASLAREVGRVAGQTAALDVPPEQLAELQRGLVRVVTQLHALAKPKT